MSALAAAPALRRPAFEVAFGGSASDWAKALSRVTVEAGLAPAVDAVEVVLAARDDAPRAELDATGSVSLGFEDDGAVKVFTGAVRAVRRTVHGSVRVVATNAGAQLAALRVDQAYEQRSAGDIVTDLASRVGLSAQVDNGADLPYYVVDSRASAWVHIARLAELSGLEAWVEADGTVRFTALQQGAPAQTFGYGADVLELAVVEAPAAVGSVTVVGDGAAGSKGSDAWSWNAKDASPVKGSAGSGDPAVVVRLGALRSSDAVNAAAQAIATKGKLAGLTARLLVGGAPKATVGSTIAIASAPDDALNGSWLVRGVRHRLEKARGYTTQLLIARERP